METRRTWAEKVELYGEPVLGNEIDRVRETQALAPAAVTA